MTRINKGGSWWWGLGVVILALTSINATCRNQICQLDPNSPLCPRGTPTATATSTAVPTNTPQGPTATPTATPSPASTATPSYLPTVATSCDQRPSVYIGDFRSAMQRYQDKNPSQFDGNYFKLPLSQDVFFYGIANELASHGLDLVIDPCMCGDVQVSASGTPLGSGFQEGYHPLSSQRYVQAAPYKGACAPKWVAYAPQVSSYVPFPLLTIDVAKLSGGKFVGPSGTCQILNFTPRFLVNGKNVPCSAEHPNCGPEGNVFEPNPDQVTISVVSQAFPDGKGATGEYLSRACGADGSAYTAAATLQPGATDRMGRPLDISQWTISPSNGNI